MLERLANDGNGNYAYIDDMDEAQKLFVEDLTSTLQVIALDAKVNIDDNALFRHKDVLEYRDLNEEDPLEIEASKYNLNYINLDGNVGNMVNGAGLAMATMDIIKLAGAEPANFLDDCPVPGTGEYYYEDPRFVGLICLEDLLVQIDEMGIEHGYNVDRVLWLGRQLERTAGKRLRSEAAINGRTLKEGHPKFARPGLKKVKARLEETPGQKLPADWAATAVLPEHLRAKG